MHAPVKAARPLCPILALLACFLLPPLTGFAAAPEDELRINPFPREVIAVDPVHNWDFREGERGWVPLNNTALESGAEGLIITMTGDDPYLISPPVGVAGPLVAKVRARSEGGGQGQFYWTTAQSPHTGEDKVVLFPMIHDGEWRDYAVPLPVEGELRQLRFDPGTTAGTMTVESVALERHTLHPVEIVDLKQTAEGLRATLRNYSDAPVRVSVSGTRAQLSPAAEQAFVVEAEAATPFSLRRVRVGFPGSDLPILERTSVQYHPEVVGEWLSIEADSLSVEVPKAGGHGARVRRNGEDVAVLAPLMIADGESVAATTARLDPAKEAILLSFGRHGGATLRIQDGLVGMAVNSPISTEGPVVRVPGELEQGLLPGVEHLGKGERSSSRLDIKTPEHIRYAPPKRWVTMPMMSYVTAGHSVVLAWRDTDLQPIFATPNFFEGTADHRMSLSGGDRRMFLRVGQGWDAGNRLEDVVLWFANWYGLPDLPEPPRTQAEQFALCLEALKGPLRTGDGWGHCVEDRWVRRPYAGHASTWFRLTGATPDVDSLAPGGIHVRNEASWLLMGQGEDWARRMRAEAEGLIRSQKDDGSYRFNGEFAATHFEDTASGVCAQPAYRLLRYAELTGDKAALDAAVKTLDYMKRFRTPRGAQVWEVPMHTPDILASAYLVQAYVKGYELTRREDFLDEARRWALSGIPFVYLWGDRPVMEYATIPVLGATHWKAPNWIGLPVQWCGLNHAYALDELAEHDDTLDWEKISRGILIAGEQMQYTEGHSKGLLPDSFVLDDQLRRPFDINPCVLVNLRLRHQEKLDAVAVAKREGLRVVAPFPARFDGDTLIVDAPAGIPYQLLVNSAEGERVVSRPAGASNKLPIKELTETSE